MTRRLLAFTAITFAVSWASWLPIIDQLGPSPFAGTPLIAFLFLLGAYSPSLMGVVLTAVYEGKSGLKALARRAVSIRVGGLWLITALLVGPIVYAASIAVYVGLGGSVGEINYGFILSELDRLGYDGWVGCEYKPKAGTSEGLGWMKPYRK